MLQEYYFFSVHGGSATFFERILQKKPNGLEHDPCR